MSHLIGKVALVTGGSRGIGAAICRRWAEDGADVALTYRHAKERAAGVVAEIGAHGRRGMAIMADSADADTTALATFYTAVLHGLAIQARDGASPATLDKVVDHAMAAWDPMVHLPATP